MALWRSVSVGIAVALIAVAAFSVGAKAQPSGAVIAVIQQSEADGQGGKRTLAVQGPVFSGDKIVTGPVGEAQIKFRDNTKLVVGPNSSMTIDAFVFAENGNAQKFSINVARGAFRFITGKGPKGAYSINTPTATIGVRGTEFDFVVERITGLTKVVTIGGSTRTCPKGIDPKTGKKFACIVSRDACAVSVAGKQEGRYVKPSQERDRIVNLSFRYLRNQSRLLPDFRLNIAACGNGFRSVQMTAAPSGAPPPPPDAPPTPPAHECPPPPPCGYGDGYGDKGGYGDGGIS